MKKLCAIFKIAILLTLCIMIGNGFAAVTNWGATHYSGLSTDTKPTGAPQGSIFNEKDTGDIYTKSTPTVWTRLTASGSTGSLNVVGSVSATGAVSSPTLSASFYRGGLYGPCVSHVAYSIYSASTATGLPWETYPLAPVTLFSCTIPGGSMGPNGKLEINTLWAQTGSSNNKTEQISFGGSTVLSVVHTTNSYWHHIFNIWNRGSETLQIMPGVINAGYNAGTSPNITTSKDTTLDQQILITAQTTTETGFTATSVLASGGTVTVTKAAHGLNTGEYVLITGATPTYFNNSGLATLITSQGTNTFSYIATSATGTASVQPLIQRYSKIRLESIDVEIKRP